MLKNRLIDEDINISSFIGSQDFSSDRDFYNNKLLNLGASSVINSINDTEVYEYKPSVNELNFNLFFLRHFQDNDISEITPYIESDFAEQVRKTKISLGLIDGNDNQLEVPFNNVFDHRQPNGLKESTMLSDRNITKLSALESKPYFLSDPIGVSMLLSPNETGLPIFYNSFTLPFWDRKNDWISQPLLYKNKPYFYNSFMLIEFYDSPVTLNQNRVISIPIFINNRYNIKEKTKNGVVHERPCFKLKEGFDGFSFFFLDNYIKTEFYAKFSFWDAANGKKIPLLPSSEQEKNKKWFQKSDDFKQENRYLKYVLDYKTKTYKIYEFNSSTNSYDLERFNFDLYELSFDKYYDKILVPNAKPYDSTSLAPALKPNNPLKFIINNLYKELYLTNSASNFNKILVNDSETYFNSYLSRFVNYDIGTSRFIKKIGTHVENIVTKRIYGLPNTTFTYPVANIGEDPITIDGYTRHINIFTAHNIDTKVWRIRKIDFENINLMVGNNVYADANYSQVDAAYNVPDKYKISEVNIIPKNSNTPLLSPLDKLQFSKKILENIDIFPYIINRYVNDAKKQLFLDNDRFGDFINFLYSVIPLLKIESSNWTNPTNDQALLDDTHIGIIRLSYSILKNNNDKNYPDINKMSVDFLYGEFNVIQNIGLILYVLDDAYNSFIPLEHPNLVFDYLAYSVISNTPNEQITKLNELNIIDVIKNINYQPNLKLRDSLINLVIKQSGDEFITPNEYTNFRLTMCIGKYAIPYILGSEKINIIGKLKISIVDDQVNVKNIYIPINVSLNVGDKPPINGGMTPEIETNNPFS